VWGVKYWLGEARGPASQLTSTYKREWRLLVENDTPTMFATHATTPRHRWGTLDFPYTETYKALVAADAAAKASTPPPTGAAAAIASAKPSNAPTSASKPVPPAASAAKTTAAAGSA